MSCERTVSVGGGLVKNAGVVFNQRTGCRTSLFVCKPAPADLGPGTGHLQGRALGQCAAQGDQKPGMLMANIQLKIKIFDAGPLFVYSITILLIRILLAALPQFLDHQLT
ncbi:MAG: hypothetical protein R6V15_11145, partial [Desulfotignum sp.]